MNLTLVFDLETTGLPKRFQDPSQKKRKYYPISVSKAYDTSRIVQIAWVVLDENKQRILRRQNYIIRPDGFTVPEESTLIHGISHDTASRDGIPILDALQEFLSDLLRCKTVVSHNFLFDANVLSSECFRYHMLRIPSEMKTRTIRDTMKLSRSMLKLNKDPKLQELCTMLLDEPIEQKHDALDDTLLCTRCYVKLRSLGYKSRLRTCLLDKHIRTSDSCLDNKQPCLNTLSPSSASTSCGKPTSPPK